METSQTITKTMLLLQTLAEQKRCGCAALTKVLEVHRSTSYRMLKSLVQLGYVDHHEDSREYSLSLKMEDLVHSGTSWAWLKKIADPALYAFYRKVNETIHLAAIQDRTLIYLSKWESTKALRVAVQSREGGRAPLHCTGLGKILLSGKSPESLEELLKDLELKAYTENTIRDRDAFKAEIRQIRESGAAFDNEEHEEGVCCLSVPLMDKHQRIMAAISITAPQVRFTPQRKEELLSAFKDLGALITEKLQNEFS